MALKFITGNKDKIEEISEGLGLEMEQVRLDLPEIQELDAKEIIRHKLLEAKKTRPGECIVEDTSLYMDCLGGKLPGPLIKWFEKALGNEGLADLAAKLGNDKARAVAIIGYASNEEDFQYFEGETEGRIVAPSGSKDFGWGPVFMPEGSSKTFGEMDKSKKIKYSMRVKAANKLKHYLNKGVK